MRFTPMGIITFTHINFVVRPGLPRKQTKKKLNSYLYRQKTSPNSMFKRLKELYQQYKPYVRVDLIMYGVMILMIILYFIYTAVFS